MSGEDFLSRWSRRKHEAKRGEASPEPVIPAKAGIQPESVVPAEAATQPAPALPPVESLTPESDFSSFMHEKVDGAIRRQALRKLFQDPRFNVMDGLDVYIDDYSKPDPLPEGWLERMNQVARLGEYRDPEQKQPEPEGKVEAAAASEPAPALENPAAEQRLADAASQPAEPHPTSDEVRAGRHETGGSE